MTSLHTDCALGSCELCDLERAVIEAAKAVEHEAPIPLGAPPTVLFLDALAKLHVAVEALQEVE